MKIKFFILPVLLFTITAFTGCKDDKSDAKKGHSETAMYQCPMDCEEGKTYSEPGKCPVCKMDLALVENKDLATCTVHEDGKCKCEGDKCACANCEEHSNK